MGDYFQHWLDMGEKSDADKLPKIFYVNWFRKTKEGKWLWPGYGENSRVLKWVFERCEETGDARKTPIGFMPAVDAIDRRGLEGTVSDEAMEELLTVDKQGWLSEVQMVEEHYARFGQKLPKILRDELAALKDRLKAD
jgi:phosphoenolpyruvate carboxykinase (GTP)